MKAMIIKPLIFPFRRFLLVAQQSYLSELFIGRSCIKPLDNPQNSWRPSLESFIISLCSTSVKFLTNV